MFISTSPLSIALFIIEWLTGLSISSGRTVIMSNPHFYQFVTKVLN
ncbi:MAG: hypothetical protein R2727_05105 [Bacteroidales bacterium]